ncbi:DUF4352 domain-containing protein [Nocardiopsis sp. CA-288880]|uniref:DUF4352 domain-containing protein n=1 Tax=Nocardiopsis sp. CA-288880 TaxID=3239995 RepID=UPI003D98B2EF
MYEQPPGGPQYPQQPPPGQPPPPQKRRAWPWVLLGCGGAALLVIILGVACTVSLFAGGAGQETADDAGEAESVGMGEPGTVGQWEVTVNGIETAATYGDEFSQETAQGEYAIVDLTVKNTGTEATIFDSSAISLVDSEGNTHSSSGSLTADSLFLEQINPGNEVSGSAAVDVPKGTEITEVEVTDTLSTEGPLVVEAD